MLPFAITINYEAEKHNSAFQSQREVASNFFITKLEKFSMEICLPGHLHFQGKTE